MDPLTTEFLGAIFRWLLTSVMAYFVAHHIITADQGAAFADGFAHKALVASPLLLPLALGLYRRYKDRVKFLTALQSKPGTSEAEVKATINKGMGASVNTAGAILLACALGGAVLTMPACGAKGKHVATVADATALAATEAADDLETAAFRAGKVPLAAHKAFSVELSKAYQAEIDIARLIKAVPAGGTIDLSQGLALLDKLKAAVSSALAALPASVRDPIANQLNKASALAGMPLGK